MPGEGNRRSAEMSPFSGFGSCKPTDERCTRIPVASFTTLKSESEPNFPLCVSQFLNLSLRLLATEVTGVVSWGEGSSNRVTKEEEGSWCVLIRPF